MDPTFLRVSRTTFSRLYAGVAVPVNHAAAGSGADSRPSMDTACQYLAELTLPRFAGTTSRFLARYVAARLGVTEQEAYRTRHRDRNLWHRVGREVRRRDPGLLVREPLAHAEISGGDRDAAELAA